ncbi:class I adenylate-forming enzyme family protein [Arthrobacter sp. M4]|uniref:class I adenylate-forming enzyme family protein n=1 Tax=Arthrobacter sp. M4 TaxID=218160 RepID=UPI001CDCB2AE|nr:class I adenylate-forming enzyme family protein [Arthrobacter sp. M4]MCA4135157.1 acyl--CoA ligase [Arthrobacter sp. M4]
MASGRGNACFSPCGPSPEAFILALGAVRAGGSIVFIDPGIGPTLFRDRTQLAGPRWAAAESLLYSLSARGPLRPLARRRGLLLPNYGAMDVRHYYAGPWLPGVPWGATSLKRLAAGGAVRSADAAVGDSPKTAPHQPWLLPTSDPEQEAVIIFTSGTTGDPRGVVHSGGSLAAAFGQLSERCTFAPGDRIHSEQLMMGLPALVAGAHWTMPAYGFSAHVDPLKLAAELGPAYGEGHTIRGATHLFLVPSQLAPILDAVEAGSIQLPSTLQTIMLGAAPVLAPFLKRAMGVLPGVDFKLIYGMTEMLPIAIADGAEKLAFAEGSQAEFTTPDGSGEGDFLGAPLPAVSIRLTEHNELVVSGANMCRSYLGQGPLKEHWTGDLVRLDHGGPDGQARLVMLGRKKDMIIRGKTNIYPALYEPLLAGIEGVAQAVMVGLTDQIGDEAVWLAVAAAAGQDARSLEARLRRELPHLIDQTALPDRIVLVDNIPTSGRHRKPDRAALRRLLAAESPTPAGAFSGEPQ